MRKFYYIFLVLLLILSLGCSQDDDDPDNATISGDVYYSPSNKVGVKDVIVLIEGPSDYNFNKIVKTDKKGHWNASVYLGNEAVEGDEGGIVYVHNYQLDVSVMFFYPSLQTELAGFENITLISGEEFEFNDFYLFNN
jgi:purine-nucleoside phosphorylase